LTITDGFTSFSFHGTAALVYEACRLHLFSEIRGVLIFIAIVTTPVLISRINSLGSQLLASFALEALVGEHGQAVGLIAVFLSGLLNRSRHLQPFLLVEPISLQTPVEDTGQVSRFRKEGLGVDVPLRIPGSDG
jgi:hypothetical protein